MGMGMDAQVEVVDMVDLVLTEVLVVVVVDMALLTEVVPPMEQEEEVAMVQEAEVVHTTPIPLLLRQWRRGKDSKTKIMTRRCTQTQVLMMLSRTMSRVPHRSRIPARIIPIRSWMTTTTQMETKTRA